MKTMIGLAIPYISDSIPQGPSPLLLPDYGLLSEAGWNYPNENISTADAY